MSRPTWKAGWLTLGSAPDDFAPDDITQDAVLILLLVKF